MPALKHTGPRHASRRSSARFELAVTQFAQSAESFSPDNLPQLLCSAARRLTGASGAAYWRAAGGAFECVYAEGAIAPGVGRKGLQLQENKLASRAVETRMVQHSSGPPLKKDGWVASVKVTASMAVPVTSVGRIVGLAILIQSGGQKSFDERDAERVAALAAIAGSRLERNERSDVGAGHSSPDVLAMVEHVKKQWMEVIDAIVDFIVVHDEHHQVLRLNRSLANFLGVQPSQLVGVSMRDLARRAGLDAAQTCLFCRSGTAVTEEYALTAHKRTYLVSGSQIHAGAEGLRTVHVLKDITDAATLRAQLLHAEKLASIGQLVAGVAHEVNNPLTAIVGFADLLVEDPDVPESAKQELRLILQEAERTKIIVQDLLHFSRPTTPERGPVDLHEIIQRVLLLRSYDFKSNHIEVVTRFDENLPEFLGDTHQLQQVILNILNNAFDATREVSRRGRIEIETRAKQDAIEIHIRDNGSGISNPDRIFDPFFTTKEPGRGTGLGLSICYGIMQAHGGEICAFNNVPQQGSTFVLRLPKGKAPAAAFETEIVQAASRGQR
jgi:PAS domain S-box-containing protein